MENNTNIEGSILLFLIQTCLIVLKLFGVIDLSWWWVLLPIWGGFALVITIFVVTIIIRSIFD